MFQLQQLRKKWDTFMGEQQPKGVKNRMLRNSLCPARRSCPFTPSKNKLPEAGDKGPAAAEKYCCSPQALEYKKGKNA